MRLKIDVFIKLRCIVFMLIFLLSFLSCFHLLSWCCVGGGGGGGCCVYICSVCNQRRSGLVVCRYTHILKA